MTFYYITLLILSLAFIYWLVMSLELLIYSRLLKKLPALKQSEAGLEYLKDHLPFTSVIVAAKDEEDKIYDCLQSILQQQGICFELIVINDRSTDRTGEIIDTLLAEGYSFETVQINRLPAGWLGKNHALWQGYQRAKGAVILFTDADVIYDAHALATAISTMEEEQLDHLTLAPKFKAKGFWLNAFVHYFFFSFGLFKRPWRANLDKGMQAIGIGAFNAVKRDCYEAIGTHRAIAMRPDDDVMLGQLVKDHCFKQRIYTAINLLSVEWYSTLGQAIRGLEKNAFAGFHYHLWLAIVAMCGQLVAFFLPFLFFILSGGALRAFSLVILLLLFGAYITNVRALGGRVGIDVLMLPVTVLLFIFVITRALWITFSQGGIYWRGTFYSLEDLKAMYKL